MTDHMACRFRMQFHRGACVEADMSLPTKGFHVSVLFGPSGCGKTTILRCIAGLDRPNSGFINFAGQTWHDSDSRIHLSPQKRGVGFLFQDYALFPHLSVLDNVAFGLQGQTRLERLKIATETLRRVDLKDIEQRFPSQISGGQQQRVALARTLACKPRLLLLDEPLSSLDEPTRVRVRGELRRMLASFEIPAILVTHDRTEAIALGDQVVVLVEGRVRQSGPVHEVFSRPIDLDVAGVLGTETVVPCTVVETGGGLVRLDVRGIALTAVETPDVFGPAFACIRAEEVLLSRDSQDATSARNHLPATITSIVHEGAMVRVTLDCGFDLTALVTRPASEELALQAGCRVTAILKAHAIHLVPRS